MDFDTQLIEEVQQYPEIYDNTHKDFKNKEVRHVIWSDIAYKLKKECDDQSVKSVRNRWKSLRDSYVKETKYKMAFSTGQTNRMKKDWKYSQAMSFLAPHLAISFPRKSQQEEYEVDAEESIENFAEEPMETYFINLDNTNQNHFMSQLADIPKDRKDDSSSPVDDKHADIDSFFRGVADTVKMLNPVNQVKIQKEIINMVLDFKLKEVQENNNISKDE